ncbi:MAG: hypothetical protein ACREQQ_04175 [Candidatus Binatia bacterium]
MKKLLGLMSIFAALTWVTTLGAQGFPGDIQIPPGGTDVGACYAGGSPTGGHICCDGDAANPDPLDGWINCANDGTNGADGNCCSNDTGGCGTEIDDDPNTPADESNPHECDLEIITSQM